MWKIIIPVVIVVGLALWLLSKGGDIDMTGEKHGIEVSEPAASASAPASAASR
ncbi:MAG: hypothetical protein ABW190_03485 [Rhizobacter sp.]